MLDYFNYIYIHLQSHRRLNGLSRPKSQVQFTCPNGGFGDMVKIEQMNGRGSTNFCIYFQKNDLMWSFTYEWNIMDVPMFFDFSSIKAVATIHKWNWCAKACDMWWPKCSLVTVGEVCYLASLGPALPATNWPSIRTMFVGFRCVEVILSM